MNAPQKPQRNLIIATILVVALASGALVEGIRRPVIGALSWLTGSGRHIQPAHHRVHEPELGIPDTVELSPRALAAHAVQLSTVTLPTRPRLLQLRGSLALDVNRLVPVRARFPGQIVEVSTIEESFGSRLDQPPRKRQLNFMDRVTKGHRLAALQSKELGEKKSELADALSRLRLDQQTLQQLEALLAIGATNERAVNEMRSKVKVGEIAVRKAERTLQSWLLTDEEIAEVRDEAEGKLPGGAAQEDRNWARVEVLAPFDGTIVEKNVVEGGLVDAGAELFKVADLSQLNAWAHAYEEDLAVISAMPRPIRWTLRVNADPNAPEIVSTIDRIGEIIDPSEHMGLLAGVVDNPHGALRAGQFITATVELPPETDVVEIPTRALVEDGTESLVLVQVAPNVPRFGKRRVAVARRHNDVVYVYNRVTPAQSALGMHPLLPGEVVVSSGALELRAIIDEQRAQRKLNAARPNPVSTATAQTAADEANANTAAKEEKP